MVPKACKLAARHHVVSVMSEGGEEMEIILSITIYSFINVKSYLSGVSRLAQRLSTEGYCNRH